MKALLKNYHQAPRKVRLIADLIRGKSVDQALAALKFMPQKSSPAIAKLLNSAVSNARNAGLPTENLFVKTIAVNKGAVLRRFNPMSRGRANSFDHIMSIVTLELGAGEVKKAKRAAKEPKADKVVKKAAPKKKEVTK